MVEWNRLAEVCLIKFILEHTRVRLAECVNPIAINTNESNMIKQPAQHPSETAIEPEVVEPPSNAIKIAPTTKVTTPDMRKIRYYFPTGDGVLMRTCTLSSQ